MPDQIVWRARSGAEKRQLASWLREHDPGTLELFSDCAAAFGPLAEVTYQPNMGAWVLTMTPAESDDEEKKHV